MALQVWLPLNGDLKNLGLDNITLFQNSGATVNNLGKIGKCYSFNATNNWILYSINKSFYSGKALSFTTWFKSDLSKASNTLLDLAADLAISCAYTNVSNTVKFSYWRVYNSNGSRAGDTKSTSNSYDASKWHHIAMVFDDTTNKIYIDGILVDTYLSTSQTYWVPMLPTSYKYFSIGKSAGSSSWTGGLMNDVRIYDHALSPKEVHEIAKGLVIHYKLDNSGLGNVNLLSPSVLDSSPAWKSALQGTEVYKGKEAVLIKTNTLYSKTSSGSTSVFPNISFKPNTQYTLSITWCDHLRTDSYSSSLYFRFKYDDGTNSSNIISPSANNNADWKHVSVTSAANKTVTMICTTYRRAGNVSIADIKLEEGNIDTGFSNTTDDDNSKIYDSSGYCNDGTIVGTTTLNLSSPRYNKCLSMNNTGTANHIEANPIGISDNIFTVSFWVKATKSVNLVLFADPKIVIGLLNSYMYVNPTMNKGYIINSFITDEWNHIVAVRNNDAFYLYVNNVPCTKNNVANNRYVHNGENLYLLNRVYNNNYAANASLSDVRVYSTILSDEDIKELYDTAAIVDNGGNMYGYLFEESIENVELNPPLANFNHTSGVSLFDGKDLVFTGTASSYSNFIEVDVSKTLTYDITYSNLLGSWFLIGFERYDENKTIVTNSGCMYILTTTNAADNKRITGTVILSAVNGNTCKFTKIRVLNCWNPLSTITGGIGKIHSFHFTQINGDGNSEVTELGQVKTGWFMEDDLLLTLISKNKYITTTQLIEM